MRIIILALCLAAAMPAGDLLARFRLTLDRVRRGGPPVYDEALILADVVPRHERRFTEFSGDVSGRWLGALAASGIVDDNLLARIIACQKPDGHFGDPIQAGGVSDQTMALLWGNGRLLVGLLETGRPAALASARRLGDWLVAMAPLLNSEATRRAFEEGKLATGYICWLQNTEGLAGLYRVTREPRYLALARELAALTVRKPAQHSHGFLTAVRGIVDLYLVTQDAALLRQAERLWREVLNSGNVLPHGAVPEAFAPDMKRDEGCAEADWLRLSLQLWRITRKEAYLERAERTIFNEFAANQFPSGDFGHRTIVPVGEITAPSARAWWCCTLHGLRAFPDIQAAAFHSVDGGLIYDLPVDASFDDGRLKVEARSTLASESAVTMRVTQGSKEPYWLGVRQPVWTSRLDYVLNGVVVSADDLRRAWNEGDVLIVRYRLIQRQEPYQDRLALLYGPWVLGIDEENSPAFFDEPHRENRLDLASMEAVRSTTHFRVRYLPGGYRSQPATAVLRPLAEQTGMPRESAWEYLFLPAR